MVCGGNNHNHLGIIPNEFSILPIGFMLFQREDQKSEFYLHGVNRKAKSLLNIAISDLLNKKVSSDDIEDCFFNNLSKVANDLECSEFESTIYSTNTKLFHCTLNKLDSKKIGCFFYLSRNQNILKKRINDSRFYQSQQSFKSLFQTFFHHVPVGIVLINESGKVVDMNNHFTELFGYSIDELVTKNIDDFIIPDNLRDEANKLTKLALNREVIKYETIRKTKSGKMLSVLIHAAPVIHAGEQQGIFLIYQDITSQKMALENVKATRKKLEQLHKTVHQMEACQDELNVFSVTLEAASNILQFDSCVIYAKEKDKFTPKIVSGKLALGDFPVIAINEGIIGQTHKTGRTIYYGDISKVVKTNCWQKGFNSVLTIPIGRTAVFQAISFEQNFYNNEDISLAELLIGHTEEAVNRITLKKQLYYQANYDALTGLINRHHFNHLLDKEVDRAKRYNYGLTFLMIDINDFKNINDTLGHLAGDRVLKEIAQIVLRSVRKCDYVVRYGGDEFLVIITEINKSFSQSKVDLIITRIKEAVNEWSLSQEPFIPTLSISVGAAHWSLNGEKSIKEVLYEADLWMYSEKHGQ